LPAALLGAKVPDLLLQPLVENALQHGIEQRPGPGTVRIVARRDGAQLVIDVHDDGVGLAAPNQDPPLGTGLGATKARLQALFGDRASLKLRNNDRGGTTASLRLPFAEAAHAA
jgi:LytS/YehU family sensor histidine kinase